MSIDKVYVSELLKTGTNNVSTSMGPLNTLRAKVTATSFSKSSFFIEVKGLSPNVLLGPYIELCQPLEIRFRNHGDELVIPNMYMDVNGLPMLSTGAFSQTADIPLSFPAAKVVDGVSTRPNGVIRAMRSCVLTLNGTSFSTTCSQWIDGVEKLYADGRAENATGFANNCSPYSGVAHPAHALKQKGRYERCCKTVGVDQIKDASYLATHVLKDVIYKFVLRTRLFLGPWLFSAFPGMGQALGDNFSGAIPYVNSLTVEGQWQDNPLIHFFQTQSNEDHDSLGVPSASLLGGYGDTAIGAGNDAVVRPPVKHSDGRKPIDFQKIWNQTIASDSGLTITPTGAAAFPPATDLCCLGQPYLNLQWLEPDLTIMKLDPTYSFASKRMTCYQEMSQVATGAMTTQFDFQHIKIDRIAELYMIYVSDAYTDVGTYRGARKAKWSTGAATLNHKGSAYGNLFAPIDWSSLRISLSTKSNILGNLDAEKLGLTEMSQYRKFLKYSQRKNPMSFKEWRMHSQCILFSAEEVFLAFGSTYQQATLNISFKCFRQQYDTRFTGVDILSFDNAAIPFSGGAGNKIKGQTKHENLMAHLVMIEPTVITLSQTACSSQDVDFSNAEALAAFRRQESSQGAEVRDSQGLPVGLSDLSV